MYVIAVNTSVTPPMQTPSCSGATRRTASVACRGSERHATPGKQARATRLLVLQPASIAERVDAKRADRLQFGDPRATHQVRHRATHRWRQLKAVPREADG